VTHAAEAEFHTWIETAKDVGANKEQAGAETRFVERQKLAESHVL